MEHVESSSWHNPERIGQKVTDMTFKDRPDDLRDTDDVDGQKDDQGRGIEDGNLHRAFSILGLPEI